MRATRSIAVMAVVTFTAALVAGVGAVAATGPATLNQDAIVLYSDEGDGQGFKLRNASGDRATMSIVKDELTNANGKAIGEQVWQCLASDVAWYCTGVIALTDAARTGAGDITFAGLFDGFNGESLPSPAAPARTQAPAARSCSRLTAASWARVVKLMP